MSVSSNDSEHAYQHRESITHIPLTDETKKEKDGENREKAKRRIKQHKYVLHETLHSCYASVASVRVSLKRRPWSGRRRVDTATVDVFHKDKALTSEQCVTSRGTFSGSNVDVLGREPCHGGQTSERQWPIIPAAVEARVTGVSVQYRAQLQEHARGATGVRNTHICFVPYLQLCGNCCQIKIRKMNQKEDFQYLSNVLQTTSVHRGPQQRKMWILTEDQLHHRSQSGKSQSMGTAFYFTCIVFCCFFFCDNSLHPPSFLSYWKLSVHLSTEQKSSHLHYYCSCKNWIFTVTWPRLIVCSQLSSCKMQMLYWEVWW